LCGCVVYAQSPLGYGIKGGVALTNEYGSTLNNLGISSDGNDFIIGPFVELRLVKGFSVEADALYQPVNLQNLSSLTGSLTKSSYMSWEFPVLAKYRFRIPAPLIKPLIEGGPAFRAHSSSLPDLTASGFTFGGGVEFKVPFVRLSSELRYTHWTAPGSTATASPKANQAELLFGIAF